MMPASLRIMSLLGLVIGVAGLPVLVAPAWVRATFSLRATPQSAYLLRIVGSMMAALGLILVVFAFSFWRAETAA